MTDPADTPCPGCYGPTEPADPDPAGNRTVWCPACQGRYALDQTALTALDQADTA